MRVHHLDCSSTCPLGGLLMDGKRKARLWNQDRLRELKAARGAEVELFCSHDPAEFERISKGSLDRPALPVQLEPREEEETGGVIAPHFPVH